MEKEIGDRIADYVVGRYGSLIPEFESKYRDLEKSISEHVGEFVLAICKNEDFHGCVGFGHEPRDREYVLDQEVTVGVLKSGQLVLDLANKRCEIPTGNKVTYWGWRKENINLQDGNLSSGWRYDFGINLNNPLILKHCHHLGGNHFELEVKVGDAEVKEWFEKQRDAHSVVMFQKAAKLLGRPISESDSPKLAKVLQQRREETVKRLLQFVLERVQMKRKIEQIYSEAERSGFSYGMTIEEAKKQALARSFPEREDLKRIEAKIEELLKSAIELGMADVQLLTVRGLCEEYGVKIP